MEDIQQDDAEWQAKKDEVLRRIGRNLVLFQQIELLLKALLSSSRIEGFAQEIEGKIRARAEAVSDMTLGELVRQYVDEVLSAESEKAESEGSITEPHFRFGFKIESDPSVIERDKAVLRALVSERNHLAHTFLTQWKPLSKDSTEEALARLDKQHLDASPVKEHLKSAYQSLVEGRKQAAEYMMSEEGRRQLELAWLQQSRLVQLLASIALTAARQDGWTLLSRAGDLIQELAPEERQQLRERYGHASLKGLLIASEQFEVRDEPTSSDQTRVVYRVKPEIVALQDRGQ